MILVTGATGFLGSYLVAALVKKTSVPIRALFHSTAPKDVFPTVEFVQCDLLDIDKVWQVMEGITHVYHCANRVSFSADDRQIMEQTNEEGTANIVNAALEHQVQKFLFVSSVAAVGRKTGQIEIDENSEWVYNKSTSAYSFSKHFAEMEVWRGQCEGLSTVIVNPSVIIGAGDADRSSVQLFKNAWNEFPYYTAGINGFVDVLDVVDIMIQLMESDITNQRFIVNAGNFSYQQILTWMANGLGKKAPTKLASPWMSQLAWIYFAIRKIFTGKKALITRETANTANQIYKYNNQKILKALPGFTFNDMEATLARCGIEMRSHFMKNEKG